MLKRNREELRKNGSLEKNRGGGRLLILKRQRKILTLLYDAAGRLRRADAANEEEAVLDHIYIGKVKRVADHIGAAFVEFAPDTMCFLPLRECRAPILTNRSYDGRILAGDEIVIQIVSEKQKSKEASASTSLSFPGKYLVLTTGRLQTGYSPRLPQAVKAHLKEYLSSHAAFAGAGKEFGLICRTNIRELTDFSILETELALLRREAEAVMEKAPHRTCFSLLRKAPAAYLKSLQDYYTSDYEKIMTDEPDIYREVKDWLTQYQPSDLDKLVFYEDSLLSLSGLYSVEARLSEALSRKVWLQSGGYLVIDRTEALTCIDVNSGKYVGKKKGEDAWFLINEEAAREIGHQLLLRNISGIIIIDFISMRGEEWNRKLLETLREVLAGDPMKADVVDMTPLGLVEVTRKKEKKSLWEQLNTTDTVRTEL